MKKSVDNRNSIDDTPLNDPVFCDTQLSEGWYHFVTAVRTRTPEEEKLHIYARPCSQLMQRGQLNEAVEK